jgi:hypothetical protein
MTTNPMGRSGAFSYVVAGLMLNEKDLDKRRPHERRPRHFQL